MMINIVKTNFQYTQPLIPLDLNNVTTIIIHHAEAFEASPDNIHSWHLKNGWAGAGYNFYVRKDGTVYEMRGLNIGAQCAGMNSKSIGICCEGNWEIDSELPERMMISLIDCINYVRSLLPNAIMIEPHMKFYATSCPGRFLFNALPRVRLCADAFRTFEKSFAKGAISSPDYWKRCSWLNINPNSDYFMAYMIGLNNVL